MNNHRSEEKKTWIQLELETNLEKENVRPAISQLGRVLRPKY